jgi:glycosyltransferase involved in cell wall biosynthesis
MPPGVDLDAWQPGPPRRNAVPRLLFVGGDFERKGGALLLEVIRHSLAGRVELDVVTYDRPDVPQGVRVHRAGANSPELRALYQRADLFVLPTRADCYSMVAIEAMAAGLPVIVGDVGGTGEIVDDGETGWVIEPTAEKLATVLGQALRDRRRLEVMGHRARAVAEARFDGARNDRRIVDLLLDLHESSKAARTQGA